MRRFLMPSVVVLACVGCFRVGPPGGPGGQSGQNTIELEVMPKPDGKTYDLIPLIDPKADRVHGDWVVTASGELRCDSGGLVPRIHVPYRPPQEYDFTVVFSQPNLRNGISLVMPKADGTQFFWYVAGGGKDYGLAAKDGNKGGHYEDMIKANVKYQTTVQVRRDRVRGCLNGRVLLDHRTNFTELNSDNWRDMKDKTILAVACDDPTTFHAVRITEVTGAGTRVR
jgi:hypothetical protein